MGVVATGADGEVFIFGDHDPNDAATDKDDEISWENLNLLVSRYNEVFDIEDPAERLEASKALVRELNGEVLAA